MGKREAEGGRNAELRRAIDQLNTLMAGKELDRQIVSARWKVSLPTADRDLKALAKVRGVVQERRGKRTVYRFDPSALLANPRLSSVIAACFGASLSSVFEGSNYEQGMRDALDFVLKQTKRRKGFHDVERKFLFVRRGGEVSLPEHAEDLDELIDAILECNWVTIDYQRFNGQQELIKIAPLSIAIYDHQLYVIGRTEKHRWYAYRFSRIKGANATEEPFEYPPDTDYDPRKIFAERFGIFMSDDHPEEDVEVQLCHDWKTYAMSHRWHPSQQTKVVDDGVVVKLRVRACPEVEAWVLSFGENARVLAPASLRKRIAKRIEKMRLGHDTTPPQPVIPELSLNTEPT